jgi:hypothetical protein
MQWLGDLERGFANAIYPNRVTIAIIVVIVAVVILFLAWRGRWDQRIGRHRRTAAAGLVVGLGLLGPAAWYLGSPLFLSTTINEPAPVALIAASPVPSATPLATQKPDPTSGPNDVAAATPTPQPSAAPRSGSFSGADDFHFARGGARLVETAPGEFTLRLEDFAVRNGPDLFVYLSPSADSYAKSAIELGRLKADRGNQNYRVPAGTKVGSAKSVVIWCKQFGVLFGTAPLRDQG